MPIDEVAEHRFVDFVDLLLPFIEIGVKSTANDLVHQREVETDVTLNSNSPLTVNIQAANIPLGMIPTVYFSTENFPDQKIAANAGLAGTVASSTATATVILNPRYSVESQSRVRSNDHPRVGVSTVVFRQRCRISAR
jgi:hypothetical protein